MMKIFTLKKTALLFLLGVVVFLTDASAQMGTNKWRYSNPTPFGFWGWQISYGDDNNALVVGEIGGIAKTTDGGGTWDYFAYTAKDGSGNLIRPSLFDVQFVTPSLAYAVGENGVLIKSTDGGVNWTLIPTPFSSVSNFYYSKINTVCFVSADTGYIGGDGDEITKRATIYKTTNGGATWQPEFEFPAPVPDYYEPGIFKIKFTKTGVGYVTGATGLVWKYQNGVWSDYSIVKNTPYVNVAASDTAIYPRWDNSGYDTTIKDFPDNIRGVSDQNYRGIAIINDTAIVVSSQNNGALVRINTSTPQGSYILLNYSATEFSKYYPYNIFGQMYSLDCKDGQKIFGTISSGQIYTSSDKGFTWQVKDVYTPGTAEAGQGFFGLDISPSGRIGLCGQGGVIADSTTQWRKPYKLVQPNGSLSITEFIDANHGIAAGVGGAMMRTNDGGDTWEDISNPTFSPWDAYTGISYLSPDVLVASASNAQLYKSVDRGSSFDLLYQQPQGSSIDGVHFINEDTGWMISNATFPDMVNYVDTFHQYIYHTTDGGTTWDTSATVFPYAIGWSERSKLREIKFMNSSVGFALGEKGMLYKSTDGGINWIKLTVPAYAADKTFRSISFIDENNIFVSGERLFWPVEEGAVVMKTDDGGNTWAMSNTGLNPKGGYPKILMYNAAEGLAFGAAVVYATTNGGNSWKPYYTTTGNFVWEFEGASFVPVPGCADRSCQKVFVVSGNNILKLDAGAVLPVKFSNLTGTAGPDGNHLFWTAFAQEEVNYFEIQRSADGVSFAKVGDKVYPGSNRYEAYNWLDVNAGTGANFYRIKAVEKSGAIFYTNVVKLATKKSAQWNYSVSNGGLILNNAKVQKGNITATIVNSLGQVAAVKTWNQNGGAFNQVMMLPPAVRGMHIVKIDNEGTTYSFKILVQ